MSTESVGTPGQAEEVSFEQVGGSTDALGGGAQFLVYISPQNNTAEVVKDWTVNFSQGDWSGSISSDNPKEALKTPGLSGEFDVSVVWRQPPADVLIQIEPLPGSTHVIGCNDNCSSMVGIVATEDGVGANYWTTFDIACK